mmetsp:Transcript_22340/g.67412  ORF Transcript_22340/g.67412 Transcript_22340/m.67412 type:complete len:238 (+) Transcript_22340:31-744(+)
MPHPQPKANPHPMHDLGSWADGRRRHGRALLYRGLWVEHVVDEERLRFQRSMNSFSRHINGALRVLDFYADAEGSPVAELAQRARHLLVYVLRVDWADPFCLALPLQLFEGPVGHGVSETEVTLPPYAHYMLEDDLALCSEDFLPGGEGPARLEALRVRWGKSLERSAPQLVEALRGNFGESGSGKALRRLRPRLSVRFVRDWTLAEPMLQLFSDPRQFLYSFPPAAAAAAGAQAAA